MMFWPNYDMGGWGYAGMAIGMVLFWFLIVGGIVALIRYSSGPLRTRTVPQPQPDSESPEGPEVVDLSAPPDQTADCHEGVTRRDDSSTPRALPNALKSANPFVGRRAGLQVS